MNPPESGLLAARTRFLLLIIVVLCLTINWANILAFNFTVICMTPKLEEKQLSNSTNFFNYEFSNAQKSRAMVAVAVGALLANIPVVTMINWYGPRYLFTAVGFFGAVATAMIPTAIKLGFNWFLAVRFLQGVAFAGDMATFGHFISYWTYKKQYAFFTATLCTYVELAPVFTNLGRDTEDENAKRNVPYKQILTSPAAWAFTPTYLNKVQNFEVLETGL
uniref:Major facilitator superfamily (MFS) profile domain-containing protein n=1 Tax=Ditylenchus dipsaci TaxID=166011 RepID=A0A915EBQ5_9BILA